MVALKLRDQDDHRLGATLAVTRVHSDIAETRWIPAKTLPSETMGKASGSAINNADPRHRQSTLARIGSASS